MPAKVVTDRHEIVRAAELDKLIRRFEVKLIWLRLEELPLHVIFGGRAVELSRDQLRGLRIRAGELAGIEGNTDEEIVLERVFERSGFRRLGSRRLERRRRRLREGAEGGN